MGEVININAARSARRRREGVLERRNRMALRSEARYGFRVVRTTIPPLTHIGPLTPPGTASTEATWTEPRSD